MAGVKNLKTKPKRKKAAKGLQAQGKKVVLGTPKKAGGKGLKQTKVVPIKAKKTSQSALGSKFAGLKRKVRPGTF